MQAVLSASSKGGVGKSEVAKLLAYQLKREDKDVAMMDADIDSSNLSSRMGIDDKRIEMTDDHEIIPIEKDGIKVYSMESAFNDSSFSQSGEFMRTVIDNMINSTKWDDPDYLIVDTPPGTKDIFDELVKRLRDIILGAVVVGQSNSIDDVGRMTKVCNHNYVPIIGYVENMSGLYMHGNLLECPDCGDAVAPFGRGNIKKLADNVEGKYLGSMPLCDNKNELEEAASNTITAMSNSVMDVEPVELPDLNEGDKGFIRNLLEGLKSIIRTINSELSVAELQEEYGNPENPRTIRIELTDVEEKWYIPSTVHMKIEGRIKIKKNPKKVHGGIKITSQELKYALQGERRIMKSPKALYSDDKYDKTPYGLVDAVQMGKADVWGEDVINYMSLMDKLMEDVIDKTEIQQALKEANLQ